VDKLIKEITKWRFARSFIAITLIMFIRNERKWSGAILFSYQFGILWAF
jgi:hypothetical protein